MPHSQPIRNLSDTALWVAYYRAMESSRPDALFHDPYAAILAGDRGEQIVKTLPHGRASAWVLSVRTHVLDAFILNAVAESGVDLVVNLAAGLDTRPYRLDLPKNLNWVEVDLPGIFDYKESKLREAKPNCHLERIRLDLSDVGGRRAIFARLNERCERALILTEGFLIYLTSDQVTELAKDLHAQPHFNLWAMDYTGPKILKYLQRRWGKNLKAGQSEMKFAPAEGLQFFERLEWQVSEKRSMIEESFRLNRTMPWAWLWKWAVPLMPERGREIFRENGGLALLKQRENPTNKENK